MLDLFIRSRSLNVGVAVFVILVCVGFQWHNAIFSTILSIAFGALLALHIAGVYRRHKNGPSDRISDIYKSFERGDGARILVLSFAGGFHPVSYHTLGLTVYLVGVLLIVAFLLSAVAIDVYRCRSLNDFHGRTIFLFVIVSLFGFTVYTSRLGVPEIGHFLEKSEYRAVYWADLVQDGVDKKIRIKAEISVGRRDSEIEDSDSFGNPTTRVVSYRAIEITRLHFPDGGIVRIVNQSELLEGVNDSTSLTDENGNDWYLTLSAEPVSMQ
jgi:hypothetical protein